MKYGFIYAAGPAETDAARAKLAELIDDALRSHSAILRAMPVGRWLSAAEIAERADLRLSTVRPQLTRFYAAGRIGRRRPSAGAPFEYRR